MRDGISGDYEMDVNDALTEIVSLLDFIVDTDDLNCSAWQDGFNSKGVIFDHSETSNQNNPFSIPNKEYIMSLPYYKELIKNRVPVIFNAR